MTTIHTYHLLDSLWFTIRTIKDKVHNMNTRNQLINLSDSLQVRYSRYEIHTPTNRERRQGTSLSCSKTELHFRCKKKLSKHIRTHFSWNFEWSCIQLSPKIEVKHWKAPFYPRLGNLAAAKELPQGMNSFSMMNHRSPWW